MCGRFRLLTPAGRLGVVATAGLAGVLATLSVVGVLPKEAGAAPRGPEQGLEGVGRWQRPLRSCRLERRRPAEGRSPAAPPRHRCRSLRLDQQLPGLLSLRLLGVDLQRGNGLGQLVVAGLLEGGSRPLVCRQLQCRPVGPLQLRVSALARSALPQDPTSATLLQAQGAVGHCSLAGPRLTCRIRSDDGDQWEVEAGL